MSRPHDKHCTPWSDKPRQRRKHDLIGIKNRIRAQTPYLGGLFTTHDVIDGNSWADIYLLSRARPLAFYNATIDTGLYAYASRCESIAWNNSEKLLAYDLGDDDEIFTKDPETGHYTLAEPSATRVDLERRAFGGLLRYEWIDEESKRLADSGDVWVHPETRLDYSYAYGIGLLATLPGEALSIATLAAFVDDFTQRGERPSRVESIKISYPSSRLSEASSINAISLNPSEWASLEDQAAAKATVLAREESETLEDTIPSAPSEVRKPRI